MTRWGGEQPLSEGERDAVVDLLTEIRNAANANIAVDRAWRLLGVLAAISGMAANDLRDGNAAKRLHRHVDTLTGAVAQLEDRG